MNTHIYIDGPNFFFSSINAFGASLDIISFCNKLAPNAKIYYYVSPLNQNENPQGYKKQQKFFEFLHAQPNITLRLGRLEKRGSQYIEKATDVNLAVDMVLHAAENQYEHAFLVSNDGDFSGAVKAAQKLKKSITYVNVSTDKKPISYHLKDTCNNTLFADTKYVQELLQK
jgi:uncharacterized LabA/DUF88 family protein